MQQGQRLRLDFQDLLAVEFGDGDVLFAEQIVFRYRRAPAETDPG